MKLLSFLFFLLFSSCFWAFGGLDSYISGIKGVQNALSGKIGEDNTIGGLKVSEHQRLLAESIKQTYYLGQQIKTTKENLEMMTDNFEDGIVVPSFENIDATCDFIMNFNQPAYYSPGLMNATNNMESLLMDADASIDVWQAKGPLGYRDALVSAKSKEEYENELNGLTISEQSKISLLIGNKDRIQKMIDFYKDVYIPKIKNMITGINAKKMSKEAKTSIATMLNAKIDYATGRIEELNAELINAKGKEIELAEELQKQYWQTLANKSTTDGTKGKILCYGFFDYQPRLNLKKYLSELSTELEQLYKGKK